MTAELVTAAVEANADWCDRIAALNGVRTARTATVWQAAARMPVGYPVAITLRPSPDFSPDAEPVGAVKDSFADLELAPLGFALLFDARWIAFSGRSRVESDVWADVLPEDFGRWREAHGEAGAFPDALLTAPGIAVLELRAAGRPAGGAILNRTPASIGVSNVFLHGADEVSAWRSLASAAHRRFGPLPVVGYERDDTIGPAIAAGFTAIGPLRVWVPSSVWAASSV